MPSPTALLRYFVWALDDSVRAEHLIPSHWTMPRGWFQHGMLAPERMLPCFMTTATAVEISGQQASCLSHVSRFGSHLIAGLTSCIYLERHSLCLAVLGIPCFISFENRDYYLDNSD